MFCNGLLVEALVSIPSDSSPAASLNGFNPGGGALAFYDASGTVNITESTIVENSVGNFDGAVCVGRSAGSTAGPMSIQITNSIISRNRAAGSPTSSNADLSTPETNVWSVNYSALGTAGGETPGISFSAESDHNIINRDLQLPTGTILADNGGPLKTVLPARASPVVNAGTTGSGAPGETDQRGNPRRTDVIDIGAVEQAAAVNSFNVNGGDTQRSRLTTVRVNFAAPVNAAVFQSP